MAVQKNFVVRHGLEVNTDLIYADNYENRVGIGTTDAQEKLHVSGNAYVSGDITVTNINISGVSSVSTLDVTTSSIINAYINTGIVTNISGTNLNYSGIGTLNSLSIGSTEVISSARQLKNITSLDSTTKSTIESAIANSPNTFTDIQITGLSTFSGNVSFGSSAFFGDNDKTNFGDSNDLQIYHNGTDSYIHEVGTGSLIIRGEGVGVNIQKVNGENLGRFLADSSVELYFDNTKKFQTTGSGSTVFGILETQGFRVNSGVSTLTTTLIGGGTSTGTVSQILQVTGGTYISGNVGLGTTNPTSKLHVIGDVLVSGVVTATTFNGDLSGTATTSTNSDNINISATTSTDTTTSVVLVGNQSTGNQSPFIDSGLTYNANTNNLTATTFTGSLSGNSSSATYATSAGIATYATSAGISTYSASAGIATYATSTGIATYSTSSGISSTLNANANVNTTGIITATGGFISVGNTTPIQISLVGDTLTFTAPGVGSTSLTLY